MAAVSTATTGAAAGTCPTAATKGSTLVEVTATGTPATLAQVEALVSQLL